MSASDADPATTPVGLSAAPSVDVRLAHLKDTTDVLTRRDELHDKRIARGEKQRTRIFWFGLCVLIISVVAIFVSVYTLMGRGPARNYYNNQIDKLACTLVQRTPPGDVLGDQLRTDHACPPYRPRTARRSSTATAPSTAPPAAAGNTPRSRGATASKTTTSADTGRASVNGRAASGATPGPRLPRSTPHRTPPASAAAPTRTPPAASKPPALLPLPACTVEVLGIHVC